MDINELNKRMQELSENLRGEGCLPKEPFMKLGKGNAPTLNYQLPQKTSFSFYGSHYVFLKSDVFKQNARVKPIGNWFDLEPVGLIQESELQDKMGGTVTNLNSDTAKVPIICSYPSAPSESNPDKLPLKVPAFGGYDTQTINLKKPKVATPKIFVIEEYKTSSYLGDYGAGQTVGTFSLLPGEKTTITVKTYKQSETTRARSENILDSFSEASVKEIDVQLQQESGVSVAEGDSRETNFGLSLGVKANAGLNLEFVSFGVDANLATTFGMKNSSTSNRAANVKNLSNALSKHVDNSNHARNVQVNTNTSESVKEGEEQTIVRELVNINKSRVLNFVFRQLMQEYVAITYLSNIKIAYSNGFLESTKIVDLENLDELLNAFINPSQIEAVRTQILKPYCSILNFENQSVKFIEFVKVKLGDCFPNNTSEELFWRILPGMIDSYSAGGLEIKVPGVILNVDRHVLRTDSVICDALLGQGEALDCFNTRIQEAEAVKAHLENLEEYQRIALIERLTDDPKLAAELYKKIFGNCCETAQTQIID